MMKTTAGATAVIVLGLATMTNPAFAENSAKPQTLTEAEKATVVKGQSLVGCMQNAQFKLILEALDGKYAEADQTKTIGEIIKKDFEAAVKTCEASAGIATAEISAFGEALIAKYGSEEETQRVIDNTFNTPEP